MTLTEVNAFLAIVRCNNIAKAAQAMGVSVSKINTYIQSLENELGITLFNRSPGKRSITLTEHGQQFNTLAYQWQELWRETTNLFAEETIGTFTIAVGKTIYAQILSKIHTDLARDMAPMHLFISTPTPHQAQQGLKRGSVNISIYGHSQQSEFATSLPIFTEELVLLCSNGSTYPQILSPGDLDIRQEIYWGQDMNLSWGNSFTSWHKYWFSTGNSPFLMTTNTEYISYYFTHSRPNIWCIAPLSIAQDLIDSGIAESRTLISAPLPRTVYATCAQTELYGQYTTILFNCLRTYLAKDSGFRLLI